MGSGESVGKGGQGDECSSSDKDVCIPQLGEKQSDGKSGKESIAEVKQLTGKLHIRRYDFRVDTQTFRWMGSFDYCFAAGKLTFRKMKFLIVVVMLE